MGYDLKPMVDIHKTKNGFTFFEIIAVLFILVIISAVIISRTADGSTDLLTQTKILKTHMRYAQTLGMGGDTDADTIFGIKCDAGFYWMFKGNDPDSNIIMLPDDQQYNTNNDGKLNLGEKKIAIADAFTVFFDHRGIPYSAYTDTETNTPLTESLAINITPAGETTPVESLTITPLTGFIP